MSFTETPEGSGTPMVVKIDRSTLINALRLQGLVVPSDARVTFKVPSGGDYSGEEVELDDGEQVVCVRYNKK